MDPLSQAAIGAAASQSLASAPRARDALWIGALAGMAPDLDVLIRSNQDPLLFLEFHRQFTHSLFFIPLGALICAIAFYPLVRRRLPFKAVWLLAGLGYATHGLLDACTTYGTQLLWPFTDARFAWHNVSVIDPLFTLPLLALVVSAGIRMKPTLAVCGMAWALAYLTFGLVQHHRALEAAEQIVSARGHQPLRLEVKPGFANVLVWKAIYEFDGRYYVDAVRVGLDTTYFPGESVPRFNLETDFPWLSWRSQQARDIERFRWFSGDWLALDNNDPNLLVDMRYSQLPNAIKGLWGISVRPDRTLESHVTWLNQRDTGSEELSQFWRQVRGVDGLPLPHGGARDR